MWIFVVASAMSKARAISLLDLPRSMSDKTSHWRFVSFGIAASIDGLGNASPLKTPLPASGE